MNLSTLVGLFASFFIFGFAMLHSTGDARTFLDANAFLIVLGGTIAASCVSFSVPKVFGMVKVFFKRMLGTNKKKFSVLVTEILALSQASRKGRSALETFVPSLKDPFLRDAAQALFFLEGEVTRDDLRSLLEARAETHFERYINDAEIFRSMAKFPPSFGLMGTTLGMITLLRTLGAANAKDMIGPSMSIALVATLYGIFLSNFIFTPIAEALGQLAKEDLVARRMVVEGVMLIAEDKPSDFVEEKVKSFLLPSERQGRQHVRINVVQKAA